jgi:hemolysin activation/secretion protein
MFNVKVQRHFLTNCLYLIIGLSLVPNRAIASDIQYLLTENKSDFLTDESKENLQNISKIYQKKVELNKQTKLKNTLINNNKDYQNNINVDKLRGREIDLERQEFELNKLDKYDLDKSPEKLRSEPKIDIISQAPEEQFSLTKVEVRNNTVLQEEINELVKSFENREVTNEELKELADQITELYVNNGYITTKAVYREGEGEIENNVAIIEVFEGEIQEVQIIGAERLENYVRQRINLATTKPLNSAKLEDQLRLLKSNPLFEDIEASLKKGTGENQSILVVKIEEADPFFGSFGFDNYSPPSIGGVEMVLDLGYRNVLGLGDRFLVSYKPRVETFDGTYNLDLYYSLPLNPNDGTLNFRTSIQSNTVIQGDEGFEELDISGESQYYDITYRQPIIRNPREELALSLGMSYRSGQTFTFQGPTPFGFGPDEDGISRTNVITFGQDYITRQPEGAWAFRSQFRVGTGIFKNITANAAPVPDGYFFAWLGQIQRIQVIDENNFLIIQGDIQLTPDSLLPSEQFVIGGGQSVRGYRQNARAGDNGFRFSIEDRITLVRDEEQDPLFQIAPFFDMGLVWNSGDNPNTLPDQRFLAGLGLGLIWQPVEGMNVRLDYAPPLVNLDDRGSDVQDDGFSFSVNYSW